MTEEAETNLPGINSDLIRQYAEEYKSGSEAGLTNLLTLFNALRRGELQARTLSQAYLNQIIRMQSEGATTSPRRISDDTSPRPERSQARETQTKVSAKPKLSQNEPEAKGKAKEKVILDLDL